MEEKVYQRIGASRLLNIAVIYDGETIYKGMVEDAPEEIKNLKYSKVEIGNEFKYYVYSKFN